MNGVALASVISSAVVGLSGGVVTFWAPITAANQERKTKSADRRANIYLDVLRTAELESRALTAVAERWAIAENYGVGTQPREVNRPDVDTQAAVVAQLRAFGSKDVRDQYDTWRTAADAIEDQHDFLHSDWQMNKGPDDNIDTTELFRKYHPAERDARVKLADLIAGELADT